MSECLVKAIRGFPGAFKQLGKREIQCSVEGLPFRSYLSSLTEYRLFLITQKNLLVSSITIFLTRVWKLLQVGCLQMWLKSLKSPNLGSVAHFQHSSPPHTHLPSDASLAAAGMEEKN